MSDLSTWNLSRTALLTIDLQNDFLHPEGAYGRAGQSSATIAALPARISSAWRAPCDLKGGAISRRSSRLSLTKTESR